MLTPQKPEGKAAGAKVKAMVAQHALQLAMLEMSEAQMTGSEEWKACLACVDKLARAFGKSEDESKQLMPAEIMQVMQQSAGPGAPPGGAAGAPGAGAPGGAPPPTVQ